MTINVPRLRRGVDTVRISLTSTAGMTVVIAEHSRTRGDMDVMESTARKTVGKHKFKMEQEQLSSNRIRSSTNQDKQINPTDAYTSITSSII